MYNGPGKYDDVCTRARQAASAEGLLLVVFNGQLGSGYSVQAPEPIVRALPNHLEAIAEQIRKQNGQPSGRKIIDVPDWLGDREQVLAGCSNGTIALHPDDALRVAGISRTELDQLRASHLALHAMLNSTGMNQELQGDTDDFSNSAYWRGHLSTVIGVANRWREALDNPIPAPGSMSEPLESLYRRTEALRIQVKQLQDLLSIAGLPSSRNPASH